ncbi:hypothetical protein LPB19_04315 [Marinobacter salinisoli]|uniref:Lipoprotein n=1 Tax=Marinobacter salinisoli TaxID=2769486 RepID=A0ABX7MTD4_9GAMM|nr:hypothetical protein [Marinobacter salinisoli]QSP95647.1 hypothetical protein LPB19_04315 [Marinobacter salinisoli]
MRHSCFFVAVAAGTLSLAGCGLESSGSSTFNPATNVNLGFSSFTLTEQMDTTLFNDLYQAVEPDPANPNYTEAQASAQGIREQLSVFLGLGVSEDQSAILSVRNPLDLMRRVIGEDEVQNFTEARQYISASIDSGEVGIYDTTTNGVSIQFTDQAAAEAGAAVQDYYWRYPTVKWVNTPDTTGNVIRTLIWVASGTFPKGSTRPSAALGTEFRGRDFSAAGYNDGARLGSEGSVVIEGEREFSFSRNYRGIQTDTIIIDGTRVGTSEFPDDPDQPSGTLPGPGFSFGDPASSISCLKIEMDYSVPEVKIYTSSAEAPRNYDPEDREQTIANPAYCTNLTEPSFQYSTVPTGARS